MIINIGNTYGSADAIKLDGTSITTAMIPFAQGAKNESGDLAEAQFRNIYFGTEELEEGVSYLPQGTIYITDSDESGSTGGLLPEGGTTNQILAKVSDSDFDVAWVNPASGSDPNAIKSDGTTTTTAIIPFAQGISTDIINSTTGQTLLQASSGTIYFGASTAPAFSFANNNVIFPDTISVTINKAPATDTDATNKNYVDTTVNTAVADKATTSYVDAAVADKATTTYVDSSVANKPTSTDIKNIVVVTALPGSPDPSTLYIVTE